MAVTQLSVYRGDDKYWNLNFTDSSGSAIDLTGSTIFFTVKKNRSDSDTNALIKKDVTSHLDAVNGKSRISLTNSDTAIDVGTYFFDIQLVDNASNVTTVVAGTFVVTQDITVRTA